MKNPKRFFQWRAPETARGEAVKIPDEEVKNLKTVGDAVAYIEANS